MARYVTLKDSNGEALYPQIKSDSIADGTIAPSKLMAPYWKVVSIVDGTNSWTLPAGYKYYRIIMGCTTTAPSTANNIYVSCDSKDSTAYTAGLYSVSYTTASAFADSFAQSDTRLAPLSSGEVNSIALSPYVSINLARSSSQNFKGYYTATGDGSNWTMQGKLDFGASSGDINLLFRRDTSTLSDFYGYVEVLVEG